MLLLAEREIFAFPSTCGGMFLNTLKWSPSAQSLHGWDHMPGEEKCSALSAPCTSAGAGSCTLRAGQPAPCGATWNSTEQQQGGSALVQLSSKWFLTRNSSVKFSLLCCTEVIQNYDLQNHPTHWVATPGSRPPRVSLSALQATARSCSCCPCTLWDGELSNRLFAISKDWLCLNSTQIELFFY